MAKVKSANDRRLVLVDGSSYLFRAYHALPALTTSKQFPTGAMHGVLNMLRRLSEDYGTDCFGVIFDPRGKTQRDEWYPEYKANRPAMPEDLGVQIPPLFDIIRAQGYPLVVVDGVEADDVIGTLARKAAADGAEVIISTGDKDLAQLVDDRVRLVNTMDDSVLDPAAVKAKFKVAPDRIVDYLTLVGDSVDNIPGVPKVGPKTAAKWLDQYGSLDAILAHAEEIKGKVGENLRAVLDQLPLSRRLVTVMDDVPLELSWQELEQGEPDVKSLRGLYQEYELKSLLRTLGDPAPGSQVGTAPDGSAAAAPAADYETVLDEAQFETWLERLEQADYFAFDTETTSLAYASAEVVGVSFAVEPGCAAYVPVAHHYPDAPAQLRRDWVLERLRPLLEDPARKKLGHHLKYDRNVLANHGVALEGIAFDSMLESYVLNSTASRHDLDSLALKYLGRNTIHFEDVAGKGAKQVTFDQVALEQAAPYAAEDADITLQLHQTLWARLAETPALVELLQQIELPLVPVLSRMECRGVLIDGEVLTAQGKELEARLAEVEAAAFEEAGDTFNMGSPKQIQEILFDRLGLPVTAKTPKGQPSTAESVLQELALDYPLPKLILEHRGLSKLKSTYVDRLPREINPRSGRVHTSYHQAVAATGRLSSSDPNLQNIPIRTAEGRRIRQAFIASPGRLLLAADYSQIELRIMAHLSGDERLRQAFETGIDVHRATAAEVFGATVDGVTAEQRRAAKAINFGLIYGMSAFGLARQLGIDRGAAQEYVDLYFERYPGVREYMDRIRQTARDQGFVETVFKRRLYLPDINARNAQRRQYAERTAINAPMQGTAADIIKRAMIAVDAWLREADVPADITMQVHDELVLEVDADSLDDVRERVVALMSAAADLEVALAVDAGSGSNWDEAH